MTTTDTMVPGLTPEIANRLRSARSSVLTTHVNPDGDGLGSELALAYALRARGAHVAILNHSTTPDNYLWLDTEGILTTYRPESHEALIDDAELIVVLDTSQPARLRSLEEAVVRNAAKTLVIDHHLDPHPFARHSIIDEEATSTGEMLYRLLRSLEFPITQKIATALYTAIMTDTGSFRYPRTDPETHLIASDLLACGADPSYCFSSVYEQWTPGRMRLLGEVLDSMKTTCDGRIAWVVCTQAMFKETATSEVETDNFTVYPMSIRGVQVGILFNELADGVKISFRSKGSIPINRLAAEFGGGGHLNAAGARLFQATLDAVVRLVIERAATYLPNS